MQSSSRYSSSSSRGHSSRGIVRSRSPSAGSSGGSSSGSLYTRSGGSSRGSDGISVSRHHRSDYPRRDSMERNVERPRYSTNRKDDYTRGTNYRYYTSDVSTKFLNSDKEDWDSAPGQNGHAQYSNDKRYPRSPSPIQLRQRRSRSRSPYPARRPRSPYSPSRKPRRSSSPEEFQAKRPVCRINSSPPRASTRCPTPPMPNRTSQGQGYKHSEPVFNNELENWDDGPTVNVNIKRNYATGYSVVQPPWRKRPYDAKSHAPSSSQSHRHNKPIIATAIENTTKTNNALNTALEDWDSAPSNGSIPSSKAPSPLKSPKAEPPAVKIKMEKMDDDDTPDGVKIKVEKLDDEVKIKVEKVEVEVAASPAVAREDGEIEPGEETPSPLPPPRSPSPPPPIFSSAAQRFSPPPPSRISPSLPPPPSRSRSPRSPSPEPLQARRVRKSINDADFKFQPQKPEPTIPVGRGTWKSRSDSYPAEPVVRFPNAAHELTQSYGEKKKYFKRPGYQKYDKHGTYGFDVNIDTDEPSPVEPLLPPPPPIHTATVVHVQNPYKGTYQVPAPHVSPIHHHQQQSPIYNMASFGVGPLGLLPHQIATLLPHQLAALVQMVPVGQLVQPQQQIHIPPPIPPRTSPEFHPRSNGYATVPEMPRRVTAVPRVVNGSDENWEEDLPVVRNGSSSSRPGATRGNHVPIDHNLKPSAAVIVRKNAVVFDYGHGSSSSY